MTKSLFLAVAIALAACSPSEPNTALAASSSSSEDNVEGEAEFHPTSGLKVIDLTIADENEQIAFRVELADSREAQARGLMFRTELGDFEGMLFPSEMPGQRSFWMKNTPLSLDIIFVGVDGRISNIAANTVPYSLDSVTSVGLASAVLELRAGRAAELGIGPGDRVEWTLSE